MLCSVQELELTVTVLCGIQVAVDVVCSVQELELTVTVLCGIQVAVCVMFCPGVGTHCDCSLWHTSSSMCYVLSRSWNSL